MALTPRAETTAAVVALLLCGAFLVSFVVGLGRPAATPALPDRSVPTLAVPPRPLGRVEVLNASGRTGLARAATHQLRSGGIDVVFFGNAPATTRDSSRVLDRTGNSAVARAAARRLGIATVVSEPDSTLFVDATIVLGSDWQLRPDSAAQQQDWRARLRRWLP